jgi:hypothetical protein
MSRTRNCLALLTVVLLGACGCVSTDTQVKPPKLEEQYNSPPEQDIRYSGPPRFPEDTLNKGLIRRVDTGGPPRGPGGMSGMGAPGMSAGVPSNPVRTPSMNNGRY